MARCFEELVANEVTLSEGRTITDADVRAFAALTGDWNEIHFNDDAARQGGYERRIVHGALVFSVSLALLQSDEVRRPRIVAFLGVERLRFVSPVLSGGAILVRQTVRSLDPVSAQAGLVEAAVEVLGEDRVMRVSYSAKFLVRRAVAGAE